MRRPVLLLAVAVAVFVSGCAADSLAGGDCDDNPDFAEAVIIEMQGAPDFDALADLEDELRSALCATGVGTFDGNLIGPSSVDLFAYGTDADEVLWVMQPVLRRSSITLFANVTRRYDDGSESRRPLSELGPAPIILRGGAASCPDSYFERDSSNFDEEVILILADTLESEALALFEDQLIGELCWTEHGIYDGTGEESGPTTMYFYGENADSLYETLRPVLRGSPLLRGAEALKRFADGTEVRFDVG